MTPQEENALIDNAFANLLTGYLQSNHRKKAEIIERAFRFARQAHSGVRRRSGEPYILHPIEVARIVSQEIGLGSTSICAALLHDVVEDTDFTVEDLERHFGPKIAGMVEGLTKISGGIFGDRASAQAENFRKLLLTMSEDIRVVLIKMADRLHNMRTLSSMPPNKQYKIAGETLYIYAPLAHRLGLFAIKTELEDLSFRYEHPRTYAEISRLLSDSELRRREVYRDFARPIYEALDAMGIKYQAKARLKSVYSIWRKMQSKHVTFDEIYDLYAMRIVFDCDDPAQEKPLCWAIYTAITDHYRLHPDRTRDWISAPKANGYQALHLTVMGPDGEWVEVQIRSRRMDEIAEKGFAAHWKYKDGDSDDDTELDNWLRTIKDILDNPEPEAIDFLDTLRLNLFESEIAVFTPKGDVLTMPANSTVLDVAFHLHSELGLRCIAAKVNHKLVPLNHRLNSGDQIEILTSKKQVPQPEWADMVATAKARNAIRAGLRKMRQPLIAKGRELLRQWLEQHQLPDSNAVITKLQGTFHASNRDELCYRIGAGEVKLADYLTGALRKAVSTDTKRRSGLLSKLWRLGRRTVGSGSDTAAAPKPPKPINPKELYTLRTDPATGHPNYHFADCCRPIPGDETMGFIEDDGSLTVHLQGCPQAALLKAGMGQRVVATRWEDTTGKLFEATILIEGIDRFGILQELTALITGHMAIDIRSLNIKAHDNVFTSRLTVTVADAATVTNLIDRLRDIKGVQSASRLLEPVRQ